MPARTVTLTSNLCNRLAIAAGTGLGDNLARDLVAADAQAYSDDLRVLVRDLAAVDLGSAAELIQTLVRRVREQSPTLDSYSAQDFLDGWLASTESTNPAERARTQQLQADLAQHLPAM